MQDGAECTEAPRGGWHVCGCLDLWLHWELSGHVSWLCTHWYPVCSCHCPGEQRTRLMMMLMYLCTLMCIHTVCVELL